MFTGSQMTVNLWKQSQAVSISTIIYIYYKTMPRKLRGRGPETRGPGARTQLISLALCSFFYFGDYKIFPDKISLVANLGM